MNKTFLTQEGFDKLQEELDFLRKDRRQEVAARLREASDGEDLIENAEYEAAKNEQAFVEGRIKELEILLATAKIITKREGRRHPNWLKSDHPGRRVRRKGILRDRGRSGSKPQRREDFQ